MVELLAVATLVTGLIARPFSTEPWAVTWVLLAAAGIVTIEASIGVERLRRRTAETPNIDLSSVWAFAAAALLPGALASGVVIVIYGYTYLRVWRPMSVPTYRVLFSTATVVLAVQAAAAVIAVGGVDPFRSVGGLLLLVGGLLVYATVNMTLVIAAIVLSGPRPVLAGVRQVLGHGDDVVLELATLSLGALTAGAVATFGPAYAALVLPPLLILHRAVLVRQLEEEANTDSKTGLLTATAWDIEADRAVRRIERLDGGNATVLVLDLDNFKQVNDVHGHLVGDQVLVAVAEAIRDVVRDGDLVGRFGGEEFVVLLPAPDGDPGRVRAEAVANRIRRRIQELHIDVASSAGDIAVDDLSVSIGGASSPADGTRLTDLVRVADAAMYAAKNAGRNRVCMGPHSIRGGNTDPAADRSRSGNDSPAHGH